MKEIATGTIYKRKGDIKCQLLDTTEGGKTTSTMSTSQRKNTYANGLIEEKKLGEDKRSQPSQNGGIANPMTWQICPAKQVCICLEMAVCCLCFSSGA